jgi:hypothetical protein
MSEDAPNNSKVWVSLTQIGGLLDMDARTMRALLVQLGYRNTKGHPTSHAINKGLGYAETTAVPSLSNWHRHKMVNTLIAAGVAGDRALSVSEKLIASALFRNHQDRTHHSKAHVDRSSRVISERCQDCQCSLDHIHDYEQALRMMDRILKKLTDAGMSPSQIDLDTCKLSIKRQDVEAYRLCLETTSSAALAKDPNRRI